MKNTTTLPRLDNALLQGNEAQTIIALIEGAKLHSPESLSAVEKLRTPAALILLMRHAIPAELRSEAEKVLKRSTSAVASRALELLKNPPDSRKGAGEQEPLLLESLRSGDARTMIRLCREGARITADSVLTDVVFAPLSSEGIRFLFKYAMDDEMRCLTAMTLIEEEEKVRTTSLGRSYCELITVMVNLFLEECRCDDERPHRSRAGKRTHRSGKSA